MGPLWCKRSAIRARSGTIPSSSSSKTVRRYISVVSISPCAVKTPLPWLCARFPWLCVRRTLTADTAGLSQHWPGRRDSRRSKWGPERRLQGHGSDHRYRKHSVRKSIRFSRRSHDVDISGARKILGRKDRGRSLPEIFVPSPSTAGQGTRRSIRHVPSGCSRYWKRSCIRSVPPCQNSTSSGTSRKPPQ